MVSAAFCLAMAIYFEARSEPIMGQIAVADVVMNKSGWNPKHVCKETFRDAYLTSLQNTRKIPFGKDKAWLLANKLANVVLDSGEESDITQGANHFYNHDNGFVPYWITACTTTLVVAHHTFCKENYE